MPEQHIVTTQTQIPTYALSAPDAALRLLDEAWSYFTPGLQPSLPDIQYAGASGTD